MANLRIVSVKATTSTTIVATFTDTLATDLTADNVSIVSQTPNVPNPAILEFKISANTLELTVQPLTALAAYIVTFQSSMVKFRNLNGTAFLIEDGRINTVLLLGPEESTNPIFQNIQNYFRDNIYNLEEGTVTNDLLRLVANHLAKALYDIRQIKNENYLSKTIVDEPKTRGPGPFDRLNEEGAYEVLRVGKNRTGYTASSEISLSKVPSYLISLRQQTSTDERLEISSSDSTGKFNLNSFVLNVAKNNVIRLEKVVFFYTSLLPNNLSYYEYDIKKYGYQLKDERYDLDYGFKFLTLEDTQFKLSDKILTDSNFSLSDISHVLVTYKYKNMGRIINPVSVAVTKDVDVTREVVEPVFNIFNLKHFPILDSTGEVATSGGVSFMDPNTSPALSKKHPAFVTEIPFSFEALPTRIGEYAVDYETGTVYVFGENSKNEGTGAYPPLATYSYRYTYQSLIDYVYDMDEGDLVALPGRELINNSADISFEFQDVLVPGIDYKADVHKEVLTERIENRLYPSVNAVKVKNTPVTNVFKIYNETQGQIYTPTRWSNDTVYFTFASEPNIQTLTGERVTFQSVLNELLFVSQERTNALSLRVFQIELENSDIISGTEDCIGSSFNTSVIISNSIIFEKEVYYDDLLTLQSNIDRLTLGDYMVDYVNGIVFVAVSADQDYDLGTVSYKRPYIQPSNPHIITPVDIYFRRNLLQPKDKNFAYKTFEEASVLPESFEVSNERYLNNDSSLLYFVLSGTVGAFIDSVFTPGVTNNIKSVRSLFENTDLINNPTPINFADATSVNDKTLDVTSKVISSLQVVEQVGSDFFVNAGVDLSYLSPNVTVTFQVVRLSDSAVLWNNSGSYILGTPLRLELPGINSPADGDNVTVTVTFSINSGSRVVVDYDRGEYYLDYTYLADEIIVSYEYGDNQIDFRESTTVAESDDYFVTYRVGALRDALLKNFASLIDIPLLTVFDENFERERYRESIMAALSSFVEGPTIESMKRIVSTITHIDPEINESIFENWSLGSSYLYPEAFETEGKPTLAKGRFGNGLLIKDEGQAITLPLTSNLRLEEGTFSSWISPRWNGLDNDAELSFIVRENGSFVPEHKIFIGAGEYHPVFTTDAMGNSVFTVSKKDIKSPLGKPNKNKDGVYIYLDKDGYGKLDGYSADGYGYDGYVNSVVTTGSFYRWYIDIIDTTGLSTYKLNISSDGEFFDAKLLYPKKNTDSITSGLNKITFQTSQSQQGLSFLSDYNHYILDLGEKDKNRVSLFKDAAGYLNFRVIDKHKQQHRLSADVSGWRANQNHHIAASWILNSKGGRDEIHLFVDGVEVPNIIRYGQGFPLFYGQKYRTVNPEEIVSLVTRPIIAGIDLTTTAGSNIVSAPISFTGAGILNGDTIYIDEAGFNTSGYTVTSVSGNTLTLGTTMPLSLAGDGQYTINKTDIPVKTRVDVFPNSAVYLVHSFYSATDGTIPASSNVLSSSSTNFIALGVEVGNIVRIETFPETHYVITAVNAGSVTLNQTPSSMGAGLTFYIYKDEETEIPGTRALFPYYQITKDANNNNIIVLRNGAQKGDLVRVKTFGSNFRSTSQTYYSWGSDGYQGSNIMHTRLPAPISLDDVKIRKVILPTLTIGPANSSLVLGEFVYTNNSVDQPVLSDTGRTLELTISGSNINFSSSVTVDITGTDDSGPASETVTFTEVGKKSTTNKYVTITSVIATVTPLNTSRPAMTLGIKELKPMLEAEASTTVAKIQFSYQVRWGSKLSGNGTTFNDPEGFFASVDVGNYIHIFSGPAAGYYKILTVDSDHKTVTVDTSAPSFTNVIYEVLNTTTLRSGLQNGVFRFENAEIPGSVYPITKGLYEISYATYISAKFDTLMGKVYLGSDIELKNQANAVIDEVDIESVKMTDTRIGEAADESIGSITSEYNALRRLTAKKTTLALLHLEDGNVTNDADIYVSHAEAFLQSGKSVNENFEKSIVIKDRSITVDNLGILNTKKEGSIEFWVSPLLDTANDPNFRFYFDASGNVSEEVTSSNRSTVTVSGNVGQVVSIRLKNGDNGKNFFGVGSIDTDKKTLRLQHTLPYQNTPVVVSYVPTGLKGDRISIYKDPYGFLTFNMRANGTDYQIRCPIFWVKDSWHRVKVTYKINGGKKKDEIRLFIDGFERGNVLYGSGLLFGQNLIFGQSFIGQGNIITTIKFTDPINEFKIGADYAGNYSAHCLIDNLRISDVSRPAYTAFGEPIDVAFNANVKAAYPVTKDLFTTYLLDFDSLRVLNTDFALLKNKNSGIFDFSLNVLDSFGIVKGSSKVKEVLETLIKTLKPANSRVQINYE